MYIRPNIRLIRKEIFKAPFDESQKNVTCNLFKLFNPVMILDIKSFLKKEKNTIA